MERISDEELKNTLHHMEVLRCLGERDCNIALYDLTRIMQEIMERRENQQILEKALGKMAIIALSSQGMVISQESIKEMCDAAKQRAAYLIQNPMKWGGNK